jgi:hypothetical protein
MIRWSALSKFDAGSERKTKFAKMIVSQVGRTVSSIVLSSNADSKHSTPTQRSHLPRCMMASPER